jgi:hypothetical protein
MGKFIIELHANGVIRDTWTVAAYKAYRAGIWDGDWPYLPAHAHILAGLPYQYRKAFERGGLWWVAQSGLCDVVRCDLYRARDSAPMGTLCARYSKELGIINRKGKIVDLALEGARQ